MGGKKLSGCQRLLMTTRALLSRTSSGSACRWHESNSFRSYGFQCEIIEPLLVMHLCLFFQLIAIYGKYAKGAASSLRGFNQLFSACLRHTLSSINLIILFLCSRESFETRSIAHSTVVSDNQEFIHEMLVSERSPLFTENDPTRFVMRAIHLIHHRWLQQVWHVENNPILPVASRTTTASRVCTRTRRWAGRPNC